MIKGIETVQQYIVRSENLRFASACTTEVDVMYNLLQQGNIGFTRTNEWCSCQTEALFISWDKHIDYVTTVPACNNCGVGQVLVDSAAAVRIRGMLLLGLDHSASV